MTNATKPVTRETSASVRRRPVIVTVSAHSIELRLKGTRLDRYTLGIAELFEMAEWREARRIAAEKAKRRKK